MDYWFAECVPCRWQTTHATQDEAITAAEEHVFSEHVRVPARERAEKVMGHVQLRSRDAIGYEFPAAEKQTAAAAAAAAQLAAGQTIPAPAQLGEGSQPSTTEEGAAGAGKPEGA